MDLTYDLFHISNLFDSSLFFVNHRDSSLSSYLKIEKIELPELFDQTFFILVFWQLRVKLVDCNQGNGCFFFFFLNRCLFTSVWCPLPFHTFITPGQQRDWPFLRDNHGCSPGAFEVKIIWIQKCNLKHWEGVWREKFKFLNRDISLR